MDPKFKTTLLFSLAMVLLSGTCVLYSQYRSSHLAHAGWICPRCGEEYRESPHTCKDLMFAPSAPVSVNEEKYHGTVKHDLALSIGRRNSGMVEIKVDKGVECSADGDLDFMRVHCSKVEKPKGEQPAINLGYVPSYSYTPIPLPDNYTLAIGGLGFTNRNSIATEPVKFVERYTGPMSESREHGIWKSGPGILVTSDPESISVDTCAPDAVHLSHDWQWALDCKTGSVRGCGPGEHLMAHNIGDGRLTISCSTFSGTGPWTVMRYKEGERP